jgi:hypothetical protein
LRLLCLFLGRGIWIDFLCTNKGAHAANGNTEKITLRFPDDREEKVNYPISLAELCRMQPFKDISHLVDADGAFCGSGFQLQAGAVYTVFLKDEKMDVETKESGIILSYPILSYPILSYPILSYPILSYPVLRCRETTYRYSC